MLQARLINSHGQVVIIGLTWAETRCLNTNPVWVSGADLGINFDVLIIYNEGVPMVLQKQTVNAVIDSKRQSSKLEDNIVAIGLNDEMLSKLYSGDYKLPYTPFNDNKLELYIVWGEDEELLAEELGLDMTNED